MTASQDKTIEMLENESFSGKRIAKESTLLLTSNAVKLGAGFATFIIFSRSLGAKELGIFALIVSFTEIVNELFEFGFDTATITEGAKQRTSSNIEKMISIVRANLLIKLILSVIILLAGIFVARPVANLFFNNQSLDTAILLGFCSIPGIMIYDVVVSVLRMEQSFFIYSILRGGSAILTLVLVLAFEAYDLLTLPAAIAVYLFFIPLISAFFGMIACYRRYSSQSKDLWNSGKELFSFGKWIYLANVTEAMRLKLNHFILIKLTSAVSLGYYYAADRLSEALILISTTLSTLLLPKASSLNDRKELRKFTIKSIAIISLILTPTLFILPFSGKIISLFFGEDYLPATYPFIILYISLIVEIICKPVVFALFSLGDSKVVFRQNMITVVILFIFSVYLVPEYSASGAAFALLVGRLAGNIYILKEGYEKVFS